MTIHKNLYFGQQIDLKTGKATGQTVDYDPANLTTHAFITGMTGSGKTGLGIILLEEAALHGIPAIIVDPKGDLTNLMLHFPNLAAQDFEPWIDPELARREGKGVSELAEETAQKWKTGLANNDLGREELLKLQDSVNFTIFTPGSTAGQPVSILSSFQTPGIAWEENSEILREKISSTVTAVLGLVGLTDIDPLRSREHILLSNLMENAWSQGRSIDLTELIMQVQKPPFDRLGAFPLNSFFPEKERFDLAVLLNNFLASPSFQTWQQGQALDAAALLYAADGRPRHSIFYLAHLNDNERMFFVTLLFSAIEVWMRAQRGTSGLRALIYFDEIMGYLPPVANPLRMLKQARAFGVGIILATQNPVDVDYKALSNTGTWMIGRLQTEQDKNRLMDGLESAAGSMDRNEYEKLISGLQKRMFLLHSVYLNGPQLFSTRWCLNFLAGPLTRAQIPGLNKLVGVGQVVNQIRSTAQTNTIPVAVPVSVKDVPDSAVSTASSSTSGTGTLSTMRPSVNEQIGEYFIPPQLGVGEAMQHAGLSGTVEGGGIVYRPVLIAQAELRYLNQRIGLNTSMRKAAMVKDVTSTLVQWDEYAWQAYKTQDLHSQPLPQARFGALPGWLTDQRRLTMMQKDFVDWLYRTGAINVHANPLLKVYAGPETTTAEFRDLCSQAARQAMEVEQTKINAGYKTKIAALEQKVEQQKLNIQEQKSEVDHRKLEEWGAGGEMVLSIFTKRRRSISSNLSKRRMTKQAEDNLDEENHKLAALEEQLKQLENDRDLALKQAQDNWAQTVNQDTQMPVQLARKDIFVELFGVAWMPYYLVQLGGDRKEIPAFAHAPK
jgi:hypothetical protein